MRLALDNGGGCLAPNPSFLDFPPGTPHGFVALCLRCLAREPRARPAFAELAGELRDMLHRLLGETVACGAPGQMSSAAAEAAEPKLVELGGGSEASVHVDQGPSAAIMLQEGAEDGSVRSLWHAHPPVQDTPRPQHWQRVVQDAPAVPPADPDPRKLREQYERLMGAVAIPGGAYVHLGQGTARLTSSALCSHAGHRQQQVMVSRVWEPVSRALLSSLAGKTNGGSNTAAGG